MILILLFVVELDAIGTGQGDNCHVLRPEEFDKETTILSYLLPDEKPYVVLKSPREEYVFTEFAFISIKGHSSVGTKKLITRYEYCDFTWDRVALSSPGLGPTDLDGTLSFTTNGIEHGIDVRKDKWEQIKPVYRTLIKLQRMQHQNRAALQLQKEMLPKVLSSVSDPKQIKDLAFALALESLQTYFPISYKAIWDAHLAQNAR